MNAFKIEQTQDKMYFTLTNFAFSEDISKDEENEKSWKTIVRIVNCVNYDDCWDKLTEKYVEMQLCIPSQSVY